MKKKGAREGEKGGGEQGEIWVQRKERGMPNSSQLDRGEKDL